MSLQSQIDQFKEEYYKTNGGKKMMIGKKNQKNDIAQQISTQFDLDTLLKQTIYLIPNTNGHIFIDYTVFKLYATAQTYDMIINRVLDIYNWCIQQYGVFTVHINLSTFSTSAAERYRNVIDLFNQKCINANCLYVNKLNKWYIYNPPAVIQMIQGILGNTINPQIIEKIEIVPKTDSPEKLKQLLAGNI
jgi:hypothetical protein